MSNYTDGCEQCEEIGAFCKECFYDLPQDLRDHEIKRIERELIKLNKRAQEIIN
jgi:hypothetical protein